MKSTVVKLFFGMLLITLVAVGCQSSEQLSKEEPTQNKSEEIITLAKMIEESTVFSANLTGFAL